MDDYAGMNEIWDGWIDSENPPARACGEVRLADDGYLVEIIAAAVVWSRIMRLVFHSETADPRRWREALCKEMPELDFRVWPDVGDPSTVDALLVWKVPPGAVTLLPNLKCIHLISAGADQIDGSTIPANLPVARLIEPDQVSGMVEYVLHAVLHHHRRFDLYRNQQAERTWQEHPRVLARDRKVGVMGLGTLGAPAASSLARLGFDVAGWSRHPRALEGVKTDFLLPCV